MLLDSRLVHAGGTAPPAVPRRYVAFVALGDHPYNYDVTMPVATPVWACRQSTVCTVCDAPAQTHCFACGRNALCEEHAMEECGACRGGVVTQAATGPVQGFQLPTAIALFATAGTTRLYIQLLDAPPPVPVPAPPPSRRFTPACPLSGVVHEDALASPDLGFMLHVGATQLVAVRGGRVGGVAYNPVDGAGASCWRYDIVAGALHDPSALEADGLVRRHDAGRRGAAADRRWTCPCQQVCSLQPRLHDLQSLHKSPLQVSLQAVQAARPARRPANPPPLQALLVRLQTGLQALQPLLCRPCSLHVQGVQALQVLLVHPCR